MGATRAQGVCVGVVCGPLLDHWLLLLLIKVALADANCIVVEMGCVYCPYIIAQSCCRSNMAARQGPTTFAPRQAGIYFGLLCDS